MLDHMSGQGVTGRLELVLVDRGVTAAAARALGRDHGLEVRRVGWDDKQPVFRPIRHAWRVEVAHGRLGRSRTLAKSFENTTTSATGWLQAACIATTLRHLSRARTRRGGRWWSTTRNPVARRLMLTRSARCCGSSGGLERAVPPVLAGPGLVAASLLPHGGQFPQGIDQALDGPGRGFGE